MTLERFAELLGEQFIPDAVEAPTGWVRRIDVRPLGDGLFLAILHTCTRNAAGEELQASIVVEETDGDDVVRFRCGDAIANAHAWALDCGVKRVRINRTQWEGVHIEKPEAAA